MSETKDLITNSLEYYDKNIEHYDKILSKIKYISFEYDNKDMKHNTVIFYNKEKKEVFRSKYEIMGAYNNYSNTWIWGWAQPKLSKNLTYISKKILHYGLDIDNDVFLKTELITSRFRISSDVQLQVHTALGSYISKIPLIFNYYHIPKYFQEEYFEGSLYRIRKIEPEDVYTRYTLFLLDYKQLA